MRIGQLRIQNFRAFDDATIDFDGFTCLVGMNGAGKSTVLNALNVFFQEKGGATDAARLSEEDFHGRDTSRPVVITATFVDLPPEALEEFQDYVRGDKLIVSAVATWDGSGADVKQYGSRLGIAEFAPCFKAANATDCKASYQALVDQGMELPAWKNQSVSLAALRAFEDAHPDRRVPIESEDNFYGIAGSSRLRRYIQWVYVPAVKDARDEQSETKDGALGKLLARTVRLTANFQGPLDDLRARVQQEMDDLFKDSQGHLDTVAASLSNRLSEWAHADAKVLLAWETTSVALKAPTARATMAEGDFQGAIARFGHGFQRSYLLTLLQELAGLASGSAPTLILGCEEPELYQHPPQARHLANVLRQLSANGSQVIVTTHSPLFVSTEFFENVRVMRRADRSSPTQVAAHTFSRYATRFEQLTQRPDFKQETAAAQLADSLRPDLNELFFARKVVLVEGTEDRAYLLTWATLTNRLPEMRRKGVEVIACGGKSTCIRLGAIAEGLGIPTYIVFDSDGPDARNPNEHRRDNRALLMLCGDPGDDVFPATTRTGNRFSQWPLELSNLVTGELTASLGPQTYNELLEQARLACGLLGNLNKNSRFIQLFVTACHGRGGASATLTALCDAVVSDAW